MKGEGEVRGGLERLCCRIMLLDCSGCVCVWHVGYPAPELRWYHILQGQTGLDPVIDDDKHFIHQLLSHGQVLSMVEIWYQMTIINVQANDYGIYVCEGTNRLGTDRIEIIIYGLLTFSCSFTLLWTRGLVDSIAVMFVLDPPDLVIKPTIMAAMRNVLWVGHSASRKISVR